MNRKMKFFLFIGLLILGIVGLPVSARADEDEIVIVVDPGHGGSQNGAEYNGILEKDINMAVSKVLVEELEKYDGVKVYLTHDSAEDTMSIQKRAEFANEVEADYFFCIHFNASANHNFYGAEAWITSYGRYYSEMYAFSEIVLNEFGSIGVFDRGIKTKLENDGTDYYGVLRRCSEFDIPAVIIEHCHMDNAKDTQFLDDETDFVKFAQLDAVAIAKFLKLKSSETGEDYSAYEYVLPVEPVEKIQNDVTEPLCKVSLLNVDEQTQKVTLNIEASDEEQRVLYFSYSYDGGNTFSELIPWQRDMEALEIVLGLEEVVNTQLIIRVYNAFNLYGDSQLLVMNEEIERFREEHAPVVEADESREQAIAKVVVQPQKGGTVYLIIAIVSILAAIVVLIALIKDLNRKNESK